MEGLPPGVARYMTCLMVSTLVLGTLVICLGVYVAGHLAHRWG